MTSRHRTCVIVGAMALFLGVTAGAFGSHALAQRLAPAMLAVFHTGVEYQLVHGLGLILIGLIGEVTSRDRPSTEHPPGARLLRAAAGCMGAGIVLFCGSLYLLALGGPRPLGMLAPVGGTAFLAGWLLLALAVWRSR